MPKQLEEIRNFHVGTILSTDSSDLTLDTASYSLDVDCAVENGVLKGVPTDNFLTGVVTINGSIIPSGAHQMSYIEIDGQDRLVVRTQSGWTISSNTIT